MNEKEFLALVNSCKGMVFKLIHYYTDDSEEAKDWLQEILFQSWKSFPNFKRDSKFSTWFYKIAINTILSQKRDVSFIKTELKDSVQNTSNIDRFENKENLDWAIRNLKPEDRFIIHLYLEGYSQEEIGGIIGISGNAAGVKIYRIKQQLRTTIPLHE